MDISPLSITSRLETLLLIGCRLSLSCFNLLAWDYVLVMYFKFVVVVVVVVSHVLLLAVAGVFE